MDTHWFRFYGRTNDEIEEFLKELKALGFVFAKSEIEDSETSCNPVIPSNLRPVREVTIQISPKEKARLIRSERAKNLYMKWATKTEVEGGKLVLRKQGDPAFQV